ncbi:15998_t:CDS:2, partial [Gigaspora rosea]
FKIKHNAAAIDKIKIPDNIEGLSPIEVLHYIKEYYSLIYQSEPIEVETLERMDRLPQVKEDDNQNLVKYITKEEIIEELAEESGHVFEKIFNVVIKKGKMPRSWCKNVITLIPKKTEDLEDKIIGIHQQGFIKGRLILELVMDIMSIMRNQSDQTRQGWLLFLDQQKAFNRVNHEYLQGVLTKMKFDPSFIQIIMPLFSEQTAYIADSGIIDKSAFKTTKVQINGLCRRPHSRYRSQAEWDIIAKMIQEYENASNAKINKIKSVLVPLMSNARCIEHYEAKKFKMLSEDESVKALGFELDSKDRIT